MTILHFFRSIQICLLVLLTVTKEFVGENQSNGLQKFPTFYVDLQEGNDANDGTSFSKAWGSFEPINKQIIPAGATIRISGGGPLKKSLVLHAKGTKNHPVTIEFEQGRYDFFPEKAYKDTFQISNTNDTPDQLKTVALYVLNSQHVIIEGNNAEIVLRGKAIETSIRYSGFIKIRNLHFDYKRPTVSEMTIKKVTDSFAVASIHPDSDYQVINGKLIWIGEGWQDQAGEYWQVFNPDTKNVVRHYLPIDQLHFADFENNTVKINFKTNPGFEERLTFQTRNILRDCAGFFIERSNDVVLENLQINFMHGMGIVAQFSKNLTYQSLIVAPRIGSGRTCSAWADILHFSGCRGQIEIKDSFLSAANDDAINVHGTHLQLTGRTTRNELVTKFMHPQTFGFQPFSKDDSVSIINKKTLLPEKKSVISQVRKIDPYTYGIILKDSVGNQFLKGNYVLENSSWQPDVTVMNSTIASIPTRGILLTSGGTLSVHDNTFSAVHSSSILVADDANSWYESGRVQDLEIFHNKFLNCGTPLININPENSAVVEEKIHANIRIGYNNIQPAPKRLLQVQSTQNVRFFQNTIGSDDIDDINLLIEQQNSKDIVIEKNKIK